MSDKTGPFIIETARIFELVDRQRAMVRLPPVDNTVKTARLNLKFNIATGDKLDFTKPEIVLKDSSAVDALTQILNEQFRVYLDKHLYSLASGYAKRMAEKAKRAEGANPHVPATSPQATASTASKTGPGLLKRLFGKKGGA